MTIHEKLNGISMELDKHDLYWGGKNHHIKNQPKHILCNIHGGSYLHTHPRIPPNQPTLPT